jgi:hypothetical protein
MAETKKEKPSFFGNLFGKKTVESAAERLGKGSRVPNAKPPIKKRSIIREFLGLDEPETKPEPKKPEPSKASSRRRSTSKTRPV